MAEWTNPIFYLNALGMVLAWMLVVRGRRLVAAGRLDGAWLWLVIVVAAGTTLHFAGDLVSFSEDADHVFIHAVLAVALLGPAVRLGRAKA